MKEDNNETDPLRHADIGTTAVIRRSKTLYSIDYTPNDFFGRDRIPGNIEVEDVEIIENDEGYPDIKITWEGEATKKLPDRWAYHRVPITEEEKKDKRKRKWIARGFSVLGFGIPLAISFSIAQWVMNGLSQTTINGQPIGPITPSMMAFEAVLVIFIFAFVSWASSGGLPPRVKT